MVRTRDPDVSRRIHEAAVQLLARDGLARMTVNDVAAEAGCGKAAIYRRYRSKDDLVVAAVDDVLPLSRPRQDLVGKPAMVSLVDDLRRALFDAGGLQLLASLLVERRRHQDLLDLWRERVVAPRVQVIADTLEASGVTGRIDARALGELALGGLVARHLSRGEVPAAASDELADWLWTLVADDTDTDAKDQP